MPALPLATSASLAGAYILLLLLLALLYAWACARSARAGAPVPVWRRVCLLAGLLVLGGGLIALAEPSRRELALHAVQDIIVGDLAPLLLALGLTSAVVAPLGRVPGLRRLRILFHPLPALLSWLGALFLWHIPSAYQSALAHGSLHALQILSTLAAGLIMWVALLGPVRQPRWFGDGARLTFALLARMGGALLGNLLMWSTQVRYDFYLEQDAARQFSPLADQNLAGAIILVAQTIMLLGVFVWLFRRAIRRDESPADQPPATAGNIVISEPSGTEVPSPSRKRMSSPAR